MLLAACDPFKSSNPAISKVTIMVQFTLPSMEYKLATVPHLFRNKFCFTGGLLEGADQCSVIFFC